MTSDCINETSRRRALWFRPKLRWNNNKKGKVAAASESEESSHARPQSLPSRPFGKVKSLFSKGFFNLTSGLKTTRRLSLPDAVMEDGTKRWKLNAAYPLITDKLYYCCIPAQYAKAKVLPPEAGFTCVTSKFPGQYFPFGQDFGPTCIAVVFRFCDFLKTKLKSGKGVIFCMNEETRMRTNAAFLLAAYLVLVEGMTPEQAVEGFQGFNVEPFLDFCDVMGSSCPEHKLSILSSLQGLHKALQVGIFNFNTFDVARYEFYDDPSNGDMHWPCNKLLAFKGPLADAGIEQGDSSFHPPEFYAEVFAKNGVSGVVRLNEPGRYNPAAFTETGIQHYDLFFEDCSAPSLDLVRSFLDICEREQGAVAVHCRAGLGRTGTLVAAWLMHRHGFSALEAIGWVRLVRPGSIVGQQQAFLQSLELCLGELVAGGALGRGCCEAVEGVHVGLSPGIDGEGVTVTRGRRSLSLLQPLSAPATVTWDDLHVDAAETQPPVAEEEGEWVEAYDEVVVGIEDRCELRDDSELMEKADVRESFHLQGELHV